MNEKDLIPSPGGEPADEAEPGRLRGSDLMDGANFGADDRPDIQLEVPGEDIYLEFLRGVVGRAARVKGFTYAGIEDFALAVDEAAVLLLETKPRRIRLELRGVRDPRDLTASLKIEGEGIDWPPANLEHDTRWQILAALCEEVRMISPAGIGLAQPVR